MRIGDVFNIGTGGLLKSQELKNGPIKRISVKSDNNGIIGSYDTLDLKEAKHFENFISVNFFGGVFYHPYCASVEMKVHTLKGKKFDFSHSSGLYFTSILEKNFSGKFSYGNQLSSSKLKEGDFFIPVPVQNGEISFKYMEKYISELEAERLEELEAERLEELEAYLLATGLSDYKLTKEEKIVVENFENPERERDLSKSFRIEELFDIQTPKKRFDANKITILDFGNPYIVRTSLNNGLRGFIKENEDYLNEKNTISFGQDTATMFYQEIPYFTGDKIKVLKSKDEKFNKKNAQFFLSAMRKSFSSFSWGSSSFNMNVISTQKIMLPITKENKPDFDFMGTFISAIQKLVIKDLVDRTNEKIKVTRAIVERKEKKITPGF